jgi:hypothetical protein
MAIKPPLQEILKGILNTEEKTNLTMQGRKIINLKRTTDKQSE